MTILVALGSNRRHVRYGAPGKILYAALAELDGRGVGTLSASSVWKTRALGPGGRDYANMVVSVSTDLSPAALLAVLHAVESAFGRRRWRRWGARVLDLDLLSYGQIVRPSLLHWPNGRGLILPHPHLHRRAFVLDPAAEVASGWRHPVLGLTIRQMQARLRAPRWIDPRGAPA